MGISTISDWTGQIGELVIGATRSEGGTRSRTLKVGGEKDLNGIGNAPQGYPAVVAYEIADDPDLWPAVARHAVGDASSDPAAWARFAEAEIRPDLIRLYCTSTRRRGFSDCAAIRKTVEEVLQATSLPISIEGSNDPAIDSEVYQKIGEAAAGERILLGTAEAGRYRSVAAAAMAYGHSIIAQSPIDINLAKQLNILLREIGIPRDRIAIDPYTGALGYGFEYSYSVMERIRTAALKGDEDLAMPMISSAVDSLTIKEVREAEGEDADLIAVAWELYAMLPAYLAGAAIVSVRHPETIPLLRDACSSLFQVHPGGGE